MIEKQYIYPKRIIIKNMRIFISKEKGAQQPMLEQIALIEPLLNTHNVEVEF